MPTDVVELTISKMIISKKLYSNLLAINDIHFNKLFVLVVEFAGQSYSSPFGFNFHFAFDVKPDPNDVTQLIAEPSDKRYIFSNPMRFHNSIAFDFFTTKPYIFE